MFDCNCSLHSHFQFASHQQPTATRPSHLLAPTPTLPPTPPPNPTRTLSRTTPLTPRPTRRPMSRTLRPLPDPQPTTGAGTTGGGHPTPICMPCRSPRRCAVPWTGGHALPPSPPPALPLAAVPPPPPAPPRLYPADHLHHAVPRTRGQHYHPAITGAAACGGATSVVRFVLTALSSFYCFVRPTGLLPFILHRD